MAGNRYEVIVIIGEGRVGLNIGRLVKLVVKFERVYMERIYSILWCPGNREVTQIHLMILRILLRHPLKKLLLVLIRISSNLKKGKNM